MRRVLILIAVAGALGGGCTGKDAGQRALDQLADLQKKKAAEAVAKKEDKLAPIVAVDVVKLEAPYNDEASTRITADQPCPEGLWALFAGDAPGATLEEKKANEANRKALAEELKAKQFIVKLRVGSGVTLKPYDAPKATFTVEVAGSIDCTDSKGRIAIAWSDAKAVSHGEPGVLAQWYWVAPPVSFSLPIKSMVEAKAFETENKIAVSARVVFTPGKVETDKRMTKVEKMQGQAGDETIEYGGGMEDWGAGRLLRAKLIGIRVATDRERKQLFDLRETPAPTPPAAP